MPGRNTVAPAPDDEDPALQVRNQRVLGVDFSQAAEGDETAQLHARIRELEMELTALREDHAALVNLKDDYIAATYSLGATEEEIRVQAEELDSTNQQCELLQVKYRDLFDHSPVGYLIVDHSGFIEEANFAAIALLARPRAKIMSRPLGQAFPHALRKDVRDFARRILASKNGPDGAETLELNGLGPQANQAFLLRGFADMHHQFGKRSMRISFTDISVMQRAIVQSKLVDTVFNSMREALVVTDVDNRIVRVNRSFSEITGYTPEEALGATPSLLNSGRQSRGFYQEMWETLLRSGWWIGEIWNQRKNGEVYPEWLTISAIRDSANDNQLEGYVAIFSDITHRKRHENELMRLAHFDTLTGLPNRAKLLDQLHKTLATARQQQTRSALLFIDLDRFKSVNDAYGHREGDILLADAAQRIGAVLQNSHTVGRVSSDEFLVVLNFATGEHEAGAVANKIIAALSAPFQIGTNVHRIGASIGVAMFPEDGDDAEALLRHADAAMFNAKQSGRNRVCHSSSLDRERMAHEARIEQHMHKALADEQFFLVYQPQVDAQTCRLAGLEALVRWRTAEGSIISPADFIPVAERTGFIVELDRHLIELGMRQVRQWQGDGLSVPQISFNISPQEFQREGIALDIMRQIRGQGLSPSQIGIEVTESSAMADLQKTIEVLELWRRVGIKVAIDDFGTGHSSLAYLRHFPASCLKIDQGFVRGIGRSAEESAMVDTMLDIARSLQLDVVAEGVETQAQYAFLRDRGCALIQGYYFSRPLSADDTAALMRKNSPMLPANPTTPT
jgi:diguanylate cyclase (GGDEF)-like protein/PAS domain S-box-containing protein